MPKKIRRILNRILHSTATKLFSFSLVRLKWQLIMLAAYSFPSQPHPLVPEFDEQVCRLRSSEAVSSSSTSVACKLGGHQDLHDFCCLLINKLCPRSRMRNRLMCFWMDLCNTAKDALQKTKESTQELQSITRRRRGGEMSLSSEVMIFVASRKVVKKAVSKAIENRCNFSSLKKDQVKDQETTEIVSIASITLTVFESLLSFISGPKSPKSSGWSLVTKMMKTKKIACEEGNEFTKVDAALSLLSNHNMKKSDTGLEENAQKQLQKLELCIQDLEGGVEKPL
ncbi:hypothetical protein PanWU01x14_110660 [Parasponia andersonii]|uniref:Uncharacterized protein n=1 Tax=Parasponia andersonii TaxID=3476 RepID=A0A2P5CYS3_PARAD|nr:hypothetical protein PanWU01x14_110660 [Parasponia andersonii]